MMERDNRRPSLLAESVRAQALIFETRLAPSYGNAAGVRMLVAFLVVGVVMFLALRFMAAAAGVRGSPAANLGFIVALLAAFIVAQRAFVGLPMAAVGLRRFADWTLRERLYLLEVVPLAAVVFAIVFANHLLGCWTSTDSPGSCCSPSSQDSFGESCRSSFIVVGCRPN